MVVFGIDPAGSRKAAALQRQGKLHVIRHFEAGKEPGQRPNSAKSADSEASARNEPSIVSRRCKFVTAVATNHANPLARQRLHFGEVGSAGLVLVPDPLHIHRQRPSRPLIAYPKGRQMAEFDRPTVAARADAGLAIDEGLRAYMLKVYNYMGIGLVVTGLVSYFTYTPELHRAGWPDRRLYRARRAAFYTARCSGS